MAAANLRVYMQKLADDIARAGFEFVKDTNSEFRWLKVSLEQKQYQAPLGTEFIKYISLIYGKNDVEALRQFLANEQFMMDFSNDCFTFIFRENIKNVREYIDIFYETYVKAFDTLDDVEKYDESASENVRVTIMHRLNCNEYRIRFTPIPRYITRSYQAQ